jgi:hypothetical protein
MPATPGFRLVEFGRDAQHFVIGRNGVGAVDLVDADLLEDRRTHVHLLDVAVEGNAKDALVAPVTIVALIGFIPVVERQLPLGHIFVERLQGSPGRRSHRATARRTGWRRSRHCRTGIRPRPCRTWCRPEWRHDVDLDAREVFERLGLFDGRFTVGSTHGEAHGLAGVFLADRFPVSGADPVLLGIPQLVVVSELVLFAVFLLDEAADVDLRQHVGRVRQVCAIGAAHIEQVHAAHAERRTRGRRALEQRAAGDGTLGSLANPEIPVTGIASILPEQPFEGPSLLSFQLDY